jgi:hypothetical protein
MRKFLEVMVMQNNDEMPDEFPLDQLPFRRNPFGASGGVRRAVLLDDDIAMHFLTSEDVNAALRGVLSSQATGLPIQTPTPTIANTPAHSAI